MPITELKKTNLRVAIIDDSLFTLNNYQTRAQRLTFFKNDFLALVKEKNVLVLTSQVTYLSAQNNKNHHFLEFVNFYKKNANFKIVPSVGEGRDHSAALKEYEAALKGYTQKTDVLFITKNPKMVNLITKLNNRPKRKNIIRVLTDINLSNYSEMLLLPFYPLPSHFIAPIVEKLNYVTNVKAGSTVYINKQKVKLKAALASGGEGVVYSLHRDKNHVVKIYKDDKINNVRINKIKLMVKHQLKLPSIAWPLALVYNENNNIIGYKMVKVHGDELAMLSKPKTFVEHYYGHYTRRDLVTLIINILETIKMLHGSGIIIDDLNNKNILFNANKEVFFVDTDSFQVSNYPALVDIPTLRPPELEERQAHEYVTLENENFTVAYLIFELLMLGHRPYTRKNKEAGNFENDGFFPYRKTIEATKRHAPNGRNIYMWHALSPRLQTMFFNTFSEFSNKFTKGKRFSAAAWVSAFAEYQTLLESGKLGREAAKLYPAHE